MKKIVLGEKRFLAIILAMTLIVSAMPTIVFVKSEQALPDQTYELILTEKAHVVSENYNGGYIPQTYDTSSLTTSGSASRARISLPSKFNRVTEGLSTSRMEDQGRFGTCWAFSTLGSAESSLFQKDRTNDVDFSQRHLAYYAYHGAKNPADNSDGTDNDSFTLQPGASHMKVGGNSQMAISTLSRGVGPELEANVPYSGGETPPPSDTKYHDAAFLKNADFLPNKNPQGDLDGTAIKTALMQRGSVSVIYGASLADTQPNGADYRTFYSSRVRSDVASSDEFGGHSVQIIGWDDTIEAAKFTDDKNGNAKPDGNGAWIIKNSWGNTQDSYFYMSYYTRSIVDLCVFDMDKTAELYDNNYQYDGIGHVTSIGLNPNAKFALTANIFTANDNESLKRIAFSTTDQETNYSIDIYTGLTDNTNPASGTSALAASQTGTAAFMGYHTIELSQPVALKKGEQFSVVILLEQPKAATAYPVAIEQTRKGLCTAGLQPNQSFVSLDKNNKAAWYDMTNAIFDDSNYANVCIKAFTDTVKDVISISANNAAAVSGVSLQDAIQKSKTEVANITELNINSGSFTKADWEYLKTLTALEVFNIKNEITSVEPMPDATATTSVFPKTILHTSLAKTTAVGKYAFNECGLLSAVTLPNIRSIDEFAFRGCSALRRLGLPVTPPDVINENAFEGTDSAKSITFFNDSAEILPKSPEAKQARKNYKLVNDGNVSDNNWHTCIIIAEYPVSYTLDGGENSQNNPSMLTLDSPATTLSPATKKGYIFVGWFDSQIGGQQITSLDGSGEKAVTLYARFKENVVTAADFAVTPPANSDGWHNSAVTVTPTNGYEQIWDDSTSSWVSSLPFSSEGAAGAVTFKLKKADGTETTNYTLNGIKIDTTAPTDSTITLETNSWKQFLNTVTFGLFFNETKNVEISAMDANSIKSIEYLLSETAFDKVSDIAGTWNTLSLTETAAKNFKGTFSIAPNSKQFIYARIKDFADNEVIINSQGIVLYTDTLITPDSQQFNKKAGAQADVTVTMTLGENTFKDITNGSYTLRLNTDYTVNNNVFTISKSYLSTLENGATAIAFNYYPMGIAGSPVKSSILTVSITDTTTPSYTVTIPEKLEIGELLKTASSSIKVVPLDVTATNVSNFYKFNQQLKITAKSTNGSKLKNAAATADLIDYKLYSSYTDETINTPLGADGLIMTVTGTAENDTNISKSFNGTLTVDTKNIKTEGNYSDTLTFTVSLEER